MAGSEMVRRVAKAICKSKTCEGFMCCQNPAQMGRRHNCPAEAGAYDYAARAAIEALQDLTPEMSRVLGSARTYGTRSNGDIVPHELMSDLIKAALQSPADAP